MIETDKKSGTSTINGSSSEIKRLAAIIMDNRVALNKGWQELIRLTQKLSSLDAPDSQNHRSGNSPFKTTADSGCKDTPPVVVVKE